MNSSLQTKRRRRNVITMALAYAATGFGLTWLVVILADRYEVIVDKK